MRPLLRRTLLANERCRKGVQYKMRIHPINDGRIGWCYTCQNLMFREDYKEHKSNNHEFRLAQRFVNDKTLNSK